MADKQFADTDNYDKAVLDYIDDLLRAPAPEPESRPTLETDDKAPEADSPRRQDKSVATPASTPEPAVTEASSQAPETSSQALGREQSPSIVSEAQQTPSQPIKPQTTKPQPETLENERAIEASRRKPVSPGKEEDMTTAEKESAPTHSAAEALLEQGRMTLARQRMLARQAEQARLALQEPPRLVMPMPKVAPPPAPTETKKKPSVAERSAALREKLKQWRVTEPKGEEQEPQSLARQKVEARRQERDAPPVVEPEVTQQEAVDIAVDSGGTPDGWAANGRPAWAQERFECLLFNVAGLKLAVPLISLGGVHAMGHDTTPLFGMPAWFIGLIPVAGMNVRVVDTAQWVMPDRYKAQYRENIRYVIRLHDSEWGLGCDFIAEAFTLDPDQVRWRSERSKRPWLAGTVVTHMCALLDVDGLEQQLNQSSVKAGKKG
ncbi:protein containing CheW-like domain [Hahella chejuensis KCTC 2396]|uniref:Protein containing CheW-like domain n=1 Tax=Hahella chejuensis (strain KCTC 2396) TaxID=349521 RepID=Q2SBY3_HAHCH|nr:chemotaxis protein CheW [Hahella chejuensis]ABC31841.1 protein containing CheW-like domain [Hahella chejuensis KCTC 2396]